MGLFSRIFSTDTAIKEVVSTVRDGLDALVHTEEEKATAAATDRTEARAMLIKWMEATSGQNLARRWLTIAITSVWLGQYILAQACAFVGIWVDNSKKWLDSANLMAGYADSMSGAVMLILGFYFAAPYMGQIVDRAMTRFEGKPKPAMKEEQ